MGSRSSSESVSTVWPSVRAERKKPVHRAYTQWTQWAALERWRDVMRATLDTVQLDAGAHRLERELGVNLSGYHFWRDLAELFRVTLRSVRAA